MQLSEICSKIISGGTPKSNYSDYYGGSIPWLRTQEINFRNIESTELSITQAGLDHSSAKWIPPNAVIVAMYGATAGKSAISKIPLTTNQACCNLIVDEDRADYRYVFYQLKYRYEQLLGLANGGAQQNLNVKIISDFVIDVPDLVIQRRIADILCAFDEKIEINHKINHHLEQMAKAIFKSWFVDFDPWGGVMPDDWREGTISDISDDIVCGKTPSTKVSEYFGDDIPFITIPDMHGRTYVTTTVRSLSLAGAESQSKKTVPTDSVCVSCIATAGLVVLTSRPSQTNQQINTIVCKSNINPFYVYLTMVGMADYIKMLGSSGSATNNLNKGQFSKIEVLIPSTRALGEFSLLVTPIFEKIKLNQQESENLAELRDTLLPRLMTGELTVSDTGDGK